MTTPLGAEAWEKLATSKPSGDNLTGRLVDPDGSSRLLCAIDAGGGRHLLITLESSDESFRDLLSRGVTADTRELTLEGQTAVRYIDLFCRDTLGYGVFDVLGGELAEGLREGKTSPADLVKKSLSRWRRFWGQPPHQMLSRDQQVGLFGELWFLSTWLAPKIGGPEAVRRWRGPFGARHDFEWTGRSIEIKSTTLVGIRIHRIHGLEQLAPPETGSLLLYSIVLREEGGATENLPERVEACRAIVSSDPSAADRFEEGLSRVGYSPLFDDEYVKLHLRVAQEGLFRVEGRFPRITPQQISGGVPNGVSEIQYDIDLAGLESLCLASSPKDLARDEID